MSDLSDKMADFAKVCLIVGLIIAISANVMHWMGVF
jgi:hypothetical protein